MAIPPILPYPMPVASDLPRNKVDWKADPKRSALLIHDMQQYFLEAYTVGESPLTELLANVSLLRSRCTELGIPVIYTAQPGGQTPEQRGLLQDFWGSGINDGPDQKKITPELAPAEHDIVLTKWRYSGFQKTRLREVLLDNGRDQLIICGIYAHIGCLMTACEAFMQDVEPFFVADAVADFNADHHRMAITYAAERCAVTTSTQYLLDELNGVQDTSDQAAAVVVEAEPVLIVALTVERMREHIAELLQITPKDIGANDDLINDLGLDSIRIMSLVERWRRCGSVFTFVELAEQATLANWQRLLELKQMRVLPNIDYSDLDLVRG